MINSTSQHFITQTFKEINKLGIRNRLYCNEDRKVEKSTAKVNLKKRQTRKVSNKNKNSKEF